MDHARGLIKATDPEAVIHDVCPHCGAPSTNLPPVRTTLLDRVPLRRCFRCGCWRTCEATARRILLCSDCGLPYPDDPETGDRCAGCRSGDFALEPPDRSLAAAVEAEVKGALSETWQFLGSERTSGYLHRVLREVAGRIPEAPADARVALVRDAAIRTLAFPSGTVLLSTGVLEALEDEAELAFVLGHELAHAASGDAARALVRLGLWDLALSRREPTELAWSRAALDLIRLGHGDRREHEADAAALAAMASLGYDTLAASRYLRRVLDRTDRGDGDLAELALAHPPAPDRLQRMDRLRSLRLPLPNAERVNREVYRRAAGHTALASDLVPVRPFGGRARRDRRLALSLGRPRWLWAVAWALGLTLVVLLYRLL
jgi:hypothetical protein